MRSIDGAGLLGDVWTMDADEAQRVRVGAMARIRRARQQGHEPDRVHFTRIALASEAQLSRLRAEDFGVSRTDRGTDRVVTINAQRAIEQMVQQGQHEVTVRPGRAAEIKAQQVPSTAPATDGAPSVAERVALARQALYAPDRSDAKRRARIIREGMVRPT